MSPLRRARHAGRQRGVAAVELALVLPPLIFMLVFPLLLGRYFYHYEVAQKAARDAARYLSAAAAINMGATPAYQNELNVANAIIAAELTDISTGGPAPGVSLKCDDNFCLGLEIPVEIAVNIKIYLKDPLFSADTIELTGSRGMQISATATMRYVGN